MDKLGPRMEQMQSQCFVDDFLLWGHGFGFHVLLELISPDLWASTINVKAQHCQLRETPLVQPPLKGLFAADPQLSLGISARGRCD